MVVAEYAPGVEVPWRGIPRLISTHQPDPLNGRKVFEQKCVFCHGSDGQGTMAAPPVWGPRSYNIGAGMARVTVAALVYQGQHAARLGLDADG
ncbi:MAG: c-type cytochrome [Nitrospira sp.]|nr:c-type cytochrome [Nitrospira sp.]